ncbi:RagB/SusD family nutrient uptake outer membrane protein [Mangrovibacterium marinum]|uniref:Putative outer membrane starch-binding protein n=1 Tax=Mangrovibacterium marinum TaxID=1639118 RepID=A0A2T5C314_9BACT|nr:RagB/SusD family nutrient uptake outer membrane protein [Mangrovibacterium marinum]PTN09089.1 putative outer membrane starch-binding protein [Mangrovibacterium marinum]
MKKRLIYMLALSTLVFSACSDSFLDSEPTTTLTDGNFYRTTDDAELAIVGCYDGVQTIYDNGIAFPVLSEVASDNCFGGTGNTDGLNYRVLDQMDLQVSPGEVNMLNDTWVAYYKSIYRCNVLLQKMDQIDWEGDTDYRNSIEAQARFLRAYAYFDMVRLWERVPLLTEPSAENIPQAPADSTYAVIARDLMFAAENGAESVEPGRVNKWAAKALLARVYLYYTGYYGQSDLLGLVSQTEALQGLEDIIASTSTTGYGLVEEYKNLWPAASSTPNVATNELETTYAGKDNKETLFAIKYNITSDYDGNTDGNHWLVMLGLRSQSFSPYGKGWGGCTVSPALYQAYDDDDARKTASVIAIAEEGLAFDNSTQREYTGYSNKKYTPLALPNGKDVAEANGAANFQVGQFQDYVVMRYADVLLMAAELGSANAQDYFDQVRGRAGLISKPVSQANLMAERRFEFAFEGLRYWDLLRQGVSTAASTIAVSTTVQDGGVDFQKVISASNITAKRGLMVIPQTQISLSNGVLTQNDGWN